MAGLEGKLYRCLQGFGRPGEQAVLLLFAGGFCKLGRQAFCVLLARERQAWKVPKCITCKGLAGLESKLYYYFKVTGRSGWETLLFGSLTIHLGLGWATALIWGLVYATR